MIKLATQITPFQNVIFHSFFSPVCIRSLHMWLYLLLSDGWQGDRNRLSVVHSRTAYDQSDSVTALFQDLSHLLTAQTVQICITDP